MTIAVISSLLYAVPLVAVAALTTPCEILLVVFRVVKIFATFVLIVSVAVLLYSAFLFLTGGGNEEALKKAKQFLIYGLIGIAVFLAAFSAPNFVKQFIGGGAEFESCGIPIGI